jgi:Leucine-rich repeat (LRR) protein
VIRLSQNRLAGLQGLASAAAPYLFLNQFSQLRVLDASCNMLTELDPELIQAMPRLQCLLLHYNRFSSSTSLRPLGLLRKLEKLTVHGCPLHESLGKREFRHTVLALAPPGLKQLDFTTVTLQEADDATTSCEMKRRTRRQSLDGTLSRNPRIRAREMGGITTMLRRPASRG